MKDLRERLEQQSCFWYNPNPTKYVALLTSGKVSNGFVNMTNLFYDDRGMELLGIMVIDVDHQILYDSMWRSVIDYVVSPAYGAIVPGFMLSQVMGCGFVWSKKEDEKFMFPFGWHRPDKRRVFFMEDVITTGGTIIKLLDDCCEHNHCYPVGIGCLVNRSGQTHISGFPIYSAFNAEFDVYDSIEESPWKGCKAIRPKLAGNWYKLTTQE